MFGRLMPAEGKFFDLFNQHAALCVKGAQEMVGLNTKFGQLHGISSLLNVITFIATVTYSFTLSTRIQ